MYADEHSLLNTPGWYFLQRTAKRQCFINVAINNSKRCSNHKQIRYKFGIKIPRSYSEALKFDRAPVPKCFAQISVQFVFGAKEDGCRKAHLVAHGDFTPEPEEAIYSSVASLRSLRYITFIA